MEEQKIKCMRCKMKLSLEKFNKKRDDTYMKNCIQCIDYFTDYRANNKCEHKRRKYNCKECKKVQGKQPVKILITSDHDPSPESWKELKNKFNEILNDYPDFNLILEF